MDYIYNHDGIRVGKTLNGTDVTTYIVDKNRPYAQVPSTLLRTGLEEQWSNGSTHPNPSQEGTISYVYGDALISRTVTHPNPSQEGTFYYHGACPERRRRDGMGSTRTLTDMSGAVTDTYSGACPEPVEGMRMDYCLTKPAVRAIRICTGASSMIRTPIILPTPPNGIRSNTACFPFIMKALKGVILTGHEQVQRLIERTKTSTGLKVTAPFLYNINFEELIM